MFLWQELRVAVRLLLKDRWFTAVAAIALGLGIGVNNTVFTLVNAVMLRGLPFDDPDRIISIGMTDLRGRSLGVSRLDFEDWRDGATSFAGLALIQFAPMNVSEEGRVPEQYQGTYNSANMFHLIGQRPQLGRDFRPDDDRPGAAGAVIISDGLWKNRYGSERGVLGRVVKVNDVICTIVGVMPPDMNFPYNNDVWLPFSQLPVQVRESTRGVRAFQAMGLLAPGVTLAQARGDIERISSRLARDFADTNKDLRPSVVTYNERVSGGPTIRLILRSMMGAVAFVLLIACANVSNLLLVRSTLRSREIAVRVAIGATRWRVVRQLLVESALLAAISGALGLGLSLLGLRLFDSLVTEVGKPYWMTFTLDGRVLAFLVAVCAGTSMIFGLAPALHLSKTDVHEVLKDAGGRSGASGSRARRWTNALIVVELALTIVLLAAAGFMMRGFVAMYQMNVGVETSHLLTMRLALPLAKYARPESRTQLYQQLEERLRGISAIQTSGLTSNGPMQGGFLRLLSIDSRPTPPGERLPEVTMVSVSPSYFTTLGAPVVRGRTLEERDGTPGHEGALVNQRFVTMHFGADDPIGQPITLIDAAVSSEQPSARVSATIVGVIPTVRQRAIQDPEPDPVVYLPYRADPSRDAMLVVRTAGDPGSLAALVREQMRAIEPDLPLFQIMTMDRLLALQRWSFRVFGSMFAIFALIALALSAVGLYAVTAYAVTQRTPEIGVRMALGAQPPQVLWLVLRRALVHLAIGIAIGIAGAFAVGRLLQTLLFQAGTSGRDPVIIVSIAALMIVVSINACFWPAWRATRIDPVTALRYE